MKSISQIGRMIGLVVILLFAFVAGTLPPRPDLPDEGTKTATIYLTVSDVEATTASPWTRVQWLAGDGNWVTVETWQGMLEVSGISTENNTLQLSGHQQWTVGGDQYGQPSFRWQLLDSTVGNVLATSDTFTLPTFHGQTVHVSIMASDIAQQE